MRRFFEKVFWLFVVCVFLCGRGAMGGFINCVSLRCGGVCLEFARSQSRVVLCVFGFSLYHTVGTALFSCFVFLLPPDAKH